jgi:acyl-CoA thioester hydrolase
MAESFVHHLRVRYGECDPQGIVFNANYLLYFDVAFTELWRVAVGPWMEMPEQHGVDAVVAEANVQFRGPARFDDELDLRVQIVRLGDTAITTEFDVLRDEELLVRGRLRHVCVSTDTTKNIVGKTPWPDTIRAGLAPYVGEPSSPGRG